MKKSEKELKEPLPKDIDRMLDWMSNHPLAQKIIEEKREEIRKRRRIVIEEIQKREKEHESRMKNLIFAVQGTEKTWTDAKEILLKAEIERNQAKWNLGTETTNFQGELALKKKVLRETTSPLIDDFVAEMGNRFDKVRNDIQEGTFEGAIKNIFTSKKTFIVQTNIRAIERTLAYIREVTQKAEALRYADQPENLEEILDQWKNEIPDHTMTERIETWAR